MDKFPLMLYRKPGNEPIHGDHFECAVVPSEKELEKALDDGWFLTTPEAVEAAKPPPAAPPTRAEMEAKATELRVPFSAKTSDTALLRAINDRIASL